MTVGKAIFYLLDNSTDLTAIVGTRIYPEVAQQDAPLPYVVYNISNNEPSDTKREPSKMDTANIEVNCYSTSYTQVIDMSVAVRAALDRVTGTYSGVNVQSIAYMNEVIDFDEGQRAYNVSSDYDVRISRTDFEIAQGSPITGVDLGDLADVNTTGVTDGQVIAYDAATAVWLPATDAGGAEQLNDLSDVIISQPSTGEFFRYDGDEWVNDSANKSDVGLGNVDNTSDANKPVSTATQTALDLKADNLRQLNDVTISGPSTDQVLQYDGADWVNATFSAAQTLEDLTDVDIADAPANGSLLEYNFNIGLWQDSGSNRLPTDGVYFHQRYETESEALRTGATATTELYFTCTAQGNGLAESASSDTPTAGKIIRRKIYYSEEGFADPDTGTWVEFTPAPADDAAFATVKAALLENLKARTGGTVPISLKQTWEEVAAAPTFTGLLNETYGSGAEAAYSTRRLNGNVTECMVIRRASDSTTTTIGFDSEGNIDEAAIETFCTGTTCTVETWKDQSGNGNDATQATPANQPTIYTGGALVKDGGRVALTSTGSTSFDFTQITDINSVFSVLRPTDFTGDSTSFILGDTSNYDYHSGSTPNSGKWLHVNHSNPVVRNGNNYLNGTSVNLTSLTRSAGQYVLSMIHTANTAVASRISQDRGIGNRSWIGNRQELIIYSDDRTNQRTDIEENVGDYFTQNTPLLDTYSGAAAAYSLRLLDSTYTGSAIRVRRSSDNTEQDIGFNIFGELDTVALAAHCGSNSGYVSKWYCQSGNGNDLTQTTTSQMPKIYDGSTGVITQNGKPILRKISSNASMRSAYDITTGGDRTVIMNHTRPINTFSQNSTAWIGNRNTDNFFASAQTSANYPILDNVTINSAHKNGSTWSYPTVRTDLWNDINGQNLYFIDADFDFGTNGFCLGFNDGAYDYAMMDTQEIVIYASDQSANRTGIETNINTFYNIY